MRILVVDDSRMNRKVLCNQLIEWGHKAVSVETGREALERVQMESFDVVLVDYRAGDMDGVEICWHLRSSQGTRHLYLMLMLPGSITNQFLEVVENGADEFLRKPIDFPWLNARLLAASRVVQMQQELVRLATTDGLTGALNRRHFLECANDEVARSRRAGRPLSVLMLDIDHFKQINDTFGHPAGDEAIRTNVRTTRQIVRGCDVLGRLGGEEFAVMLPDTARDGALVVAERLRRSMAVTAVAPAGVKPFNYTVSIGVAWLGADDHGIDSVLARADEALYRAKRGGRNRVVTQDAVPAEVQTA
ncbi:diguanylate cyclase (GGDEF)-like protein [Azospirillum fermentarium]|uniref:diguanylate cyclase n=1 Tax=Azospirillum fermentarium TaxID=1233114 RepID=UPI0022270436|nr:diguanylate cyclase [Azospirillum fermentarium]MCW2248088.1 diguanylate cyclase (GGDEF)-like protein [Azospirillum fermentarium]